MNNEKLDNLLNLALNATVREREESRELNVGFDAASQTWQVIVKASGGLGQIEEQYPNVQVQTLLNGYAILTVPQELLEELSQRPEIEYMEKPKRLFFAVNEGRQASCLNSLQSEQGISALPGRVPEGLYGKGILVAVIDSGIDYSHPDFRNEDGTTRIVELWDQDLDQVFEAAQINEALRQEGELARYAIVPSRDLSGHGTHVAGIACGNGRASGGLYRGMAPQAPMLIVKLGNSDPDGFPRTTELMQAVDYVLRRAASLGLPVAVNLSFGNNYGSHDGTSLLETYLDDVSSYWKNVIVAGTGNEGDSRIHTSGNLAAGGCGSRPEERADAGAGNPGGGVSVSRESCVIQLAVGEYEPALNLQLWKSYTDQFEIRLRHPDGSVIGPLNQRQYTQRYETAGTELLIYYGMPRPYSVSQEIYVDFLPSASYVTPGVWEIILTPEKIVDGRFDLWLPGQASLSEGTGFLTPTEERTLTIPSTASKVISVGAYHTVFDTYAPFSGRGSAAENAGQRKPDLAAPGVRITSCAPGGGYSVRSGTSMAAPFVTGGAALLMEWAIRLQNDPYLFGEKVKAYLQRGARQLPGFDSYPNAQVGYGALCVGDSLPE